jgi:hypothetical protein
MVNRKQFIKNMEGFIKEGSAVQKTDPLKLKKIWITGRFREKQTNKS